MRRSPLAAALAVLALFLLAPAASHAAGFTSDPFSSAAVQQLAAPDPALPAGFTDTTVFSGLVTPTAIRFAPDGKVFVAQKSGIVNEYDSLSDTTPTRYVDLSRNVDDFIDRGLLGLAIDPGWNTGRPYIYVMYTYDKDPNRTAFPAWNDNCPDPPGADSYGCPAVGRLSRIDPDGTEHVLIQDWCTVYSTHTVADLRFGPDGALYASAGDGASFTVADYGQGDASKPTPPNACGDPPVPVGGDQSPPTAEGGALRSQAFRRAAGEPVTLDGSIIRVNPDTGDAMPDNPAIGDANANRRRIVAYGFRNPFRFTFRPGTSEVWMGDVGWNTWEEVNRLPNLTTIRNYGWPCYEGQGRQPSYDALNVNICESLYSAGTAVGPWFQYNHGDDFGTCGAGTSSPTGIAFYTGTQFPSTYQNALFVADYARACIYVFRKGADGAPDPSTAAVFAKNAGFPVDVQMGPDGSLYYADIVDGTIQRISYPAGNHSPTARATATPDHGPTPLTVQFNGTTSSDPDNDTLTYSWDLNGDGTFGDSTAATPSFTYTTPGVYTVRLRVSDPAGNTDTVSVPIQAGTPPTPVIDAPSDTFTWATGDTISYSGHATDSAGNAVPASGLSWQLNIRHCARTDTTSCHTHFGTSVSGVSSGSFVAPNHDWPSHLELVLTATANGLSASQTIQLQPKTATLTLNSTPAGASDMAMGADAGTAPFTETFIQNSTTDVTAPAATTIGGSAYAFSGWSDGGARTHTVTIPRTNSTLTASFVPDTSATLAGNEGVGTSVSQAPAGAGEVYKMSASKTGTVTRLRLYVDGGSTATALTLGMYADLGGTATTRLGQGSTTALTPNAWNEVTLTTPVSVTAGTSYWFALLNPTSSTGTLRWRDHAGGLSGQPEQTSADRALSTLPTTWAAQGTFSDGPVSGYAVGSTNSPPPTPTLSVSPTSLAFSATVGQGNPASKTVTVSNTGGGTLSFTASDDATWLSESPTSGGAGQDVTVSVNTAGLTAGTYSANLTIDAGSASGSPKVVPVTLTVADTPPPGDTTLGGASVIGTGQSSAPVGAGEAYRFTATTAGTAGKLRLYVDSGNAASQLILGLYADNGGNPGALLASGQISGLTAAAWNEVPLSTGINLTAGTNYWFALLNPTGSAGVLRWRDHAGGSGGPERTSQNRSLSALPATWASQGSFTDGPISGYVVGSTGTPPPPVLSVSPTSLTFSGTAGDSSPASKTLTVSNTGGGTLNFTASDDQPWLTVSPGSGSAPRDLTVAVNTSGLAAGTYTATITIDGGSISGSPRTIPVTLTLNPPTPPALSITPTSLTFTGTAGGSAPASKAVTVSNTGGGTLSYTASDDQTWLSATPATGTAPGTVNVGVDPTGLAAGTYTGTVTITASGATGSPKTVAVTLTLNPPTPPALSITPSSMTFGATVGGAAPPTQPVSISNTGGGTLSWTASDDQPWLSATPASGAAPGTVNVGVDPTGLAAGTYTGTVTITAASATGSPKTVSVTFTVSPPATGLVGAWGFDETSGATATDKSGKGNNGTITGATRTATGKFGGALSFSGTGKWVTVPDSTSLHLTTGLTVEGWINPTANGSGSWRALAVKETATGLSWALYPFGDANFPSAHAFTSSEQWARATTRPTLNTWTHVAETYDGTTIRLYLNGVQAATKAQTGALVTSTQPLRFGGDAPWGEWFQGTLDEIRVYNRALSATEITTDMSTPITPPA